jgi:predicted solute-binding protein
MGILPFKANYSYKLKILLSPKQVKKSSETAKERVKTFINLYKNL